MEIHEAVVGAQPHERGEGRRRAGIALLELGEGFEILRGRRVGIGFRGQRLEGAQRLRLAAQHEIADRAAAETSARSVTFALTQMRVPSCLFAASRRAAVLIVSP